MRNSLETRVGIFVALTVLAAVFILEMTGGVERFTRGYHVTALFENVQELKEGDRVKMAGVEIGRVEKIELADGKARVRMKIKRNAGVRTDSTASIRFAGLGGQNYVAIGAGTPGGRPAENDTILTSVEQADLNSIMAKLDNVATGVENLTKSFTGDEINNLLGPFTDFLKANREPLTHSISNMQAISTQVARGEGTIGKLIFDDALHTSTLTTVSNLQLATDDIKLTLSEARKVVEQVNAGQGTLGKLAKDEALYNDAAAFMANMREISMKINQGTGTVGKLVNDREFYNNGRLALQKLEKATEGLEDQGPLSVLGIMVNSLF